MTDSIQTIDLTREQLLDLADAEGRKLGFYLAASDLTDEVKEGITEIIQHATFEQILTLSKAFEEGFLLANNRELDTWFVNRLSNIKAEYDESQQKIDEVTLSALDKLDKAL